MWQPCMNLAEKRWFSRLRVRCKYVRLLETKHQQTLMKLSFMETFVMASNGARNNRSHMKIKYFDENWKNLHICSMCVQKQNCYVQKQVYLTNLWCFYKSCGNVEHTFYSRLYSFVCRLNCLPHLNGIRSDVEDVDNTLNIIPTPVVLVEFTSLYQHQ